MTKHKEKNVKVTKEKEVNVEKEPLTRVIHITNAKGKISTEAFNFMQEDSGLGIRDYLATLMVVLVNASYNAGITEEQLKDLVGTEYKQVKKQIEERKEED